MPTDTGSKAQRRPEFGNNVVPFNRPFLSGRELEYIQQAVQYGHISGNGPFSKKCQEFFKQRYGFNGCLLTSSCTDALEMCALLLNIKPGDEVILPSYTFVSTANAFALRGAKLVFADSSEGNPNIDPGHVGKLISPNTRAIVIVHYGGIACDMDRLLALSQKHQIPIVEDAAHAIDSFHKQKPLGSLGALATFSFHETKNINCGEGGLLVINDKELIKRAEIIWEKGTNRSAFARGEVRKYTWIDLGSSFLPSEVTAAFLFSQLENLTRIQTQRISRWKRYYEGLSELVKNGKIKLPVIPDYATVNGHLFPIITKSLEERNALLEFLDKKGVNAVFHYIPLHESPFITKDHTAEKLDNVKRFAECLIRLPLFFELTNDQVDYVCEKLQEFYLA